MLPEFGVHEFDRKNDNKECYLDELRYAIERLHSDYNSVFEVNIQYLVEFKKEFNFIKYYAKTADVLFKRLPNTIDDFNNSNIKVKLAPLFKYGK